MFNKFKSDDGFIWNKIIPSPNCVVVMKQAGVSQVKISLVLNCKQATWGESDLYNCHLITNESLAQKKTH